MTISDCVRSMPSMCWMRSRSAVLYSFTLAVRRTATMSVPPLTMSARRTKGSLRRSVMTVFCVRFFALSSWRLHVMRT